MKSQINFMLIYGQQINYPKCFLIIDLQNKEYYETILIQSSMLFTIPKQISHSFNRFFYTYVRLYQFITVFQIYNFTLMKLFSNNRQKLTLNRVRKPSTPPKMSMEVINGCKLTTLHNQLTIKDTNIIKLGNSSIFKKQSDNEVDKRQRIQHDIIRCRSISWVDNGGRSNAKIIPALQKLNSSTLEEKSLKKRIFQRIIHQACNNLILSYKQRGILAMKSNFYCISIQSFNDLVAQLSQRVIQETIKTDKKHLSEFSANKDSQSSEISQKHEPNFRVYNQFSLNQEYRGIKKLSYQTSNINIHLQYQQSTRQRNSFWKIVEEYETQKPTQQNFNFLLDKNKYLKQEIGSREIQLKKIRQNIEELQGIIGKKNIQILSIQENIKQHEKCLGQVEKVVKDLQGFINKQPNRILQQEAQGYKQRQQQLFDLAFLLQQSAPSSISTFVQQSIMIPYQSFKLTLKTFPHELHDQESYVISPKDMNAFKSSISSAYESTIEKLRVIIEKKAAKIKNFVGIMRRLASYTIGKRQYLTQINKKMAVVSINADKKLKIIEQCCKIHNENQEKLKIVLELKQLISNMRSIYCQAEVFY